MPVDNQPEGPPFQVKDDRTQSQNILSQPTSSSAATVSRARVVRPNLGTIIDTSPYDSCEILFLVQGNTTSDELWRRRCEQHGVTRCLRPTDLDAAMQTAL